MCYSVTKDGVCAKHLCVIDEVNKTVSTNEAGLVFDFGGLSGWSFKTGHGCTFKTGYSCTFKTSSYCTFKTGDSCTFNTGSQCTIYAGYNCTFKVGDDCTFNTSWGCTFKVGEKCVVIRRDIYEVIELMSGVTIKLNEYQVVGYVFNRDEYIEKIGVNEEKLVFKLANEEWVSCIQ